MVNKGVLLLIALSVASASLTPVERQDKLEDDLCGPCVALMDDSLQLLIEVVLNVEIIGGCEDICSYLPNELDSVVCDAICFYVGIDEFIKFLDKADLDPVYYCQLIDVCPHTSGGDADTVELVVSPTSGPVGTTFEITFVFNVTSPTSTGYTIAAVFPPEGFPLESGSFNQGYKTGIYTLRFQLDTAGTDQDGFPLFNPGTAEVKLQICEGECGSAHPWSAILDTALKTFELTPEE